MTHQRYTASAIHHRLGRRHPIVSADPIRQAYNCPYYVPLTGVLGSDWGVCVNPQSIQFGHLLFEHEDCGCVGDCPRGNQRKNQWVRRETEEEIAAIAAQVKAIMDRLP